MQQSSQTLQSSSFRIKFCLGIAAFLLPLLVFAGGTFYVLDKITASYHQATDEMVEEIPPVSDLKTLIFLIQITPNNFPISHDPDEEESFRYLVHQIDIKMDNLLQTSFDKTGERALARLAVKVWKEGRLLADQLLASRFSLQASEAREVMQDFDAHLSRTTWALNQLELFAFNEIREEQRETEQNIDRLRSSLGTTLFIGLFIALLSGLLLARAVFTPLKMLAQGAASISQGEFKQLEYPLQNEFGAAITAFNAMSISLQKMQDDLKELAMRDSLTGLFNRRELEILLAQELENAKRGKESVSLILLDIDHFKQINDTYGHQVGDRVLRNLAKLLAQQVRARDHLARYGGEEFIIITPSDETEARNVAERIRARIEQTPQQDYQENSFKVTVSLGIASYPLTAGDVEELIRQADKALYEAKQAGRNRTCAYKYSAKN